MMISVNEYLETCHGLREDRKLCLQYLNKVCTKVKVERGRRGTSQVVIIEDHGVYKGYTEHSMKIKDLNPLLVLYFLKQNKWRVDDEVMTFCENHMKLKLDSFGYGVTGKKVKSNEDND